MTRGIVTKHNKICNSQPLYNFHLFCKRYPPLKTVAVGQRKVTSFIKNAIMRRKITTNQSNTAAEEVVKVKISQNDYLKDAGVYKARCKVTP